jgi:hypothetical protein
LNCKPNDLCLIIRGVDSGKTLTVIELLPPGSVIPGREAMPDDPQNRFARALGHVWRTDRELMWYYKYQPAESLPFCPDAHLMPIRPDDDLKLAFETERHLDNAEAHVRKLNDMVDRHGREVKYT